MDLQLQMALLGITYRHKCLLYEHKCVLCNVSGYSAVCSSFTCAQFISEASQRFEANNIQSRNIFHGLSNMIFNNKNFYIYFSVIHDGIHDGIHKGIHDGIHDQIHYLPENILHPI